MAQTAIDWLLEQTMYMRSTKWPDIIEQAKAMEQQQIIDAFNAGQAKEANEPFWTKGNYYYEQKYGKHTDSNL
jgi:uncharacterized metal-binding protein